MKFKKFRDVEKGHKRHFAYVSVFWDENEPLRNVRTARPKYKTGFIGKKYVETKPLPHVRSRSICENFYKHWR